MSKRLVIVESPTKCRTLSKFLGDNYEIIASKGHIYDLPPDDLGVDVNNNFEPKYVKIEGKASAIKEIRKASKNAEIVFLASDPDREGEAIAWHISRIINPTNKDVYRILFNEITKEAVLAGIENKGNLDMKKVYAQQARRILDRLVGYKVSPILWKTYYRGLSAGRVQSVALRLICEREAEIEAFTPKEYWNFYADFAWNSEKLETRLKEIKGKKFDVDNQADAEKVENNIKAVKSFSVARTQKSKYNKNSPPPYITSSLQLDAARRYRFTASKTMSIAQSLYEGIELGDEGPVGLITYMRTDSTRISKNALSAAGKYITSEFGSEYLSPSQYKGDSNAQDAHEAIRPTSVFRTPEMVKKHIDNSRYKLYSIIWQRFVASQMKPAIFEQFLVDIKGGDYTFAATHRKKIFDGYLKLYSKSSKSKKNIKQPPALSEGDAVNMVDLTKKQGFTKPAPRFSEGTLIQELKKNGVGRPSTYAPIISTLFSKNYVKRHKRKLLPTDIGREINSLLIRLFSDVFDVNFTARLEKKLDQVERGHRNWVKLLKDFYDPFSDRLESIQDLQEELQKKTIIETDYVCEKCGADMVVKWGKYGKFLACTNFPQCKNSKPLPPEYGGRKEMEEVDKKCSDCGATLVVKYSKQGRKFLACSAYPDCNYTESFDTKLPCPVKDCEGTLLERYTKRGKKFYGCSTYPDCQFASWNEPLRETCPQCGASTIFEKSKQSKTVLYCELCDWKEVHAG